MTQISHLKNWHNLGVILRTCGCINYLNIVSLISTSCVTYSTSLANPLPSNIFIISLCKSLTEISINIFEDNYFISDFWFKTVKESLDTHDGLTLGWKSINPRTSSINNFDILLILEQPLIDYSKSFSIRDISAFIFCPLLTKLHTALRPRLIYFIKYFIGGSNTVVSETPLLI